MPEVLDPLPEPLVGVRLLTLLPGDGAELGRGVVVVVVVVFAGVGVTTGVGVGVGAGFGVVTAFVTVDLVFVGIVFGVVFLIGCCFRDVGRTVAATPTVSTHIAITGTRTLCIDRALKTGLFCMALSSRKAIDVFSFYFCLCSKYILTQVQ